MVPKQNIVIIGNDVLSKKVRDILMEQTPGFELTYISVKTPNKQVHLVMENVIQRTLNKLCIYVKQHPTGHGILAIEDNLLRNAVFKKIRNQIPLFKYINVIDNKTVVIGKNVNIGNGVIILSNSIINSDASIENFCIIHEKVSVGHDSNIKEFVNLNINVTIAGDVLIGAFTTIHMSANVMNAVSIGEHCVVDNNTLVNKNIISHKIVSGVPSKVI